jgi:hypothetical protein
MKALPTKYDGITFRSRNEARWAIFFDVMGIKWTYEEQGYKLSNGETYLPDFRIRLASGKYLYVEAKPDNFDKFDVVNHGYLTKLYDFSKESGCVVLIIDGNPDKKPYDLINGSQDWPSLQLAFWQDYDPYIRIADAYWFSYVKMYPDGKMWIDADDRAIKGAFGKQYIVAIERSRAEKFGI